MQQTQTIGHVGKPHPARRCVCRHALGTQLQVVPDELTVITGFVKSVQLRKAAQQQQQQQQYQQPQYGGYGGPPFRK